MSMSKTILKSKNQKYIVIGIILLLSISVYLTQNVVQQPTSSLTATITYIDGTTQIFDSNILKTGTIYSVNNQPIQSVRLRGYLKPVIKGSDGGYPTTLPSGYTLTYWGATAMSAAAYIGNSPVVALGLPAVGSSLLPNQNNNIFDREIGLAQIESYTANIPIGGTFTISVPWMILSQMGAKLNKPDGSTDVITPNNNPTLVITVKKEAEPTSTPTSVISSSITVGSKVKFIDVTGTTYYGSVVADQGLTWLIQWDSPSVFKSVVSKSESTLTLLSSTSTPIPTPISSPVIKYTLISVQVTTGT